MVLPFFVSVFFEEQCGFAGKLDKRSGTCVPCFTGLMTLRFTLQRRDSTASKPAHRVNNPCAAPGVPAWMRRYHASLLEKLV